MQVEGSIVRSTFRALLEPRRLVPIFIVCASLVLIQWRFSRDVLAPVIGVAMCSGFVLVAPLSWRVLFPDGIEFSHGAIRLLLFATIGTGVVLVLGNVLPSLLNVGPTLLTHRTSLFACITLFLAGGWGLGRDIGFEESLARERARGRHLAREAERAQLLALRSHLDPHFLFNTLNAIAEWCREDGEVAERAVLELASILRAVLAGVKEQTWSLGEELKLVRALLSLHLLRDPSLFGLEWSVPEEAADVPVPPMILLPIAENAVKHGPSAGHKGAISVNVSLTRDDVRARIENPGPYAGPRAGSDGLPTVERRLALAYDGNAALTIARVGDRTAVELVLPLAFEPKEAA